MTRAGDRLLGDGPRGDSPAEIRHRTLAELRETIRHHPAVDAAAGVPDDGGRFRELEVAFDPRVLGVDAESARLRIDWRPRADPSEPAYFVFHYYDSTGRDIGWHREPNPHVDRLEHVQVRHTADAAYEYEPAYFEVQSPVELLWDVLGRIEDRVSVRRME